MYRPTIFEQITESHVNKSERRAKGTVIKKKKKKERKKKRKKKGRKERKTLAEERENEWTASRGENVIIRGLDGKESGRKGGKRKDVEERK